MIVFSSLSQIDTINKICFPRYVVIGIQKDLIRLDYCDSIRLNQDIFIHNLNSKISFQDSIISTQKYNISLYKDNENIYKNQIQLQKNEINIWKKETKKQKRITIISITTGIVLLILTLISK